MFPRRMSLLEEVRVSCTPSHVLSSICSDNTFEEVGVLGHSAVLL